MAQEMLNQRRDQLRAARGGLGHKNQSDADSHENAAVERGQQKIAFSQRDHGEHGKPEGQHEGRENGADQIVKAFQADGNEKQWNIKYKVGDRQRDSSGNQMLCKLLDNDGDTGEASGDQAGRFQHGSCGKCHHSCSDDDKDIISEGGFYIDCRHDSLLAEKFFPYSFPAHQRYHRQKENARPPGKAGAEVKNGLLHIL